MNEKIAKAFIEAQKEMDNATKDSKNPFFKSKYADLNAVREACIPALNKYGIGVLQPTIQIEGKNYVKTLLLHESGESIESLTEIIFGKANDAQAQGSGITYARRYGLQSLVCIGAEDDDGNEASKGPHSRLANIVDDEEMQQLKQQKKESDAAEKQKRAENYFAKTKLDIEGCGSQAEIEAIFERDKKIINSLQEKYPSLFTMLFECGVKCSVPDSEENSGALQSVVIANLKQILK